MSKFWTFVPLSLREVDEMISKLPCLLISFVLVLGPISMPYASDDMVTDEGTDTDRSSPTSRASSYVRSQGGFTMIGNDHIEIQLNESMFAGVDKIIDKATGHDFRNNKVPPPIMFMLYIFNGTGDQLLLNWDPSMMSYNSASGNNFAKMSVHYYNLGGYALNVTATITVRDQSPMAQFRLRIHNNDNITLKWVSFPVIWGLGPIGAGSSDDSVLFPRGDGLLLHDPLSKVDTFYASDMYPSSLSMQLMGYYDEDEAGLYTATYDASGNPKEMIVSGMEWNAQKHLAAQYKLMIPESEGNDLMMDYDCMVGTFHGDWHVAADIYKEWADNASFTAGGKVFEDKDVPDWWSNTSVIQMVNRDDPAIEIRSLDEMVDITGHFSDTTGLNTTLMMHGWEGNGAWVGPYYYPPVEGEAKFKDVMSRMGAKGDRGFTYISGTVWRVTRDDIGYADHELFNSTGLEWVAINETGGPTFDPFYETLGWHSARMDPMTTFWHNRVVYNALESVRLGAQVVQVDEFPIGSIYPCYNASHGHELGYTKEMVEAYQSIMSDIRTQGRALDPDFVLSMEEPNELYIDYMDTYVSRDNAPEFLLYGHTVDEHGDDAEFIPLFSWVYHEYITAFGEHLPLADYYPIDFYPQVARALGRTFIDGELQNGAAGPADELRPGLMELYNRTARATADHGNKYLIKGRPLLSPDIDVPLKEIQWYKWYDGTFGTPIHERTVLNSAWEADDGEVGLTFVNWDNDTHTFDVEVPAYDLPPENLTLTITRNGDTSILLKRTELPVTVTLTMEKNDVVLIEVTKGPDLSVEDEDLHIDDLDPLTNEEFDLNLTVHNTGTSVSGPFEVYFYSKDIGGNIVPIGSNQSVTAPLGPGENTTVGVKWNTTGLLGNHTLHAVADITHIVEELYETNNSACINVTVQTRPTANLFVKVIESDTNFTLKNASIEIFHGRSADPFNQTGGGFTNSTGETSFLDLKAGEYHLVVKAKDHYDGHRNITLEEGQNLSLIIKLDWRPPEGWYWTISGAVYENVTLFPLKGVNTTAFNLKYNQVIDWSLSDDRGEYTLKGLETGQIYITASLEGYYLSVVEILVNYSGATIDFYLDPIEVNLTVGIIEGYVTELDTGVLLENVNIALDDPPVIVQTDEDGYYILKSIPEGLCTIYAYKFPEYEMNHTQVTVLANQTIVQNLTLKKKPFPHNLPTFMGKVVDEEGNPILNAKVERYNHVDPLFNFTDINGTFKFDDLETGDYIFRISKEGYISNITKRYFLGYGDLVDISVTLKTHTDPNPEFKPPPGSIDEATFCICVSVLLVIGAITVGILIYMQRTKKKAREADSSKGPEEGGDEPVEEEDGQEKIHEDGKEEAVKEPVSEEE